MKKIFLVLFILLAMATASHGQAISQTGGSIQGSITDASGAVVPGASIVIANPATGYTHSLTSDKAGFYSLGPLNPGTYTITVTAPNFQTTKAETIVNVGTVTSGNEKLIVGQQSETIEVTAGQIQINTEQVGVAGIVTREQIDTLPINGRNILDVAQVQPGVQLQSGQAFDPTKTGYSAIAVNGNNGRSTRVLIDGQDISDETVGTVVFNVPSGAISEFQLNRSTQDVSGSVTSTGQVLMATQSGTNRFHGNAFYNFQDYRAGFANVSGAPAPFQRNQFGGYLGGFVIKDKLFFFGGGERIQQVNSSPVGTPNAFFTAIYQRYTKVPDPFKDNFSMARLDFNGPWGVHYFARATYSTNAAFSTFGQAPYALAQNQDNVPAIVGGADFTTGKFTHSVRFGYLKFINDIAAGANALGSTIYNPSSILGFPFELIGSSIYSGAGNEDAPQKTFQSNKQFRYDGTWTKGAHNIKYGGEVSRILEGGFAAFYSTFLTSISTSAVHQLATCDTTTPFGGVAANGPAGGKCLDDPLYGYSPNAYYFGNGNGSGSERPGFGLPGGANFSWRMAAYVGDTWKITPSFTMVAGVRWSVDTDRADQDLPTPTCGQLDSTLAFTGCGPTSNPNAPLFDQFAPGLGLGARTQQNWANFGPQAGFVYSPNSHRFSLRGGVGIYYENNLFNNQGNARAQNTQAQFPAFAYGSNGYTSSSLNLPGYVNGIHGVTSSGTPCNVGSTTTDPGCISFPSLYSMSIAKATAIMSQLDTKYKAAAAASTANPSFIGDSGGDGLGAFSAYAGPYKTPYSLEFNGGGQFEIVKGLILNVDFIHNATLKVPLTVDVNHVGAARYLNVAAAQSAITASTTAAGCTGGSSAGAINCLIAKGGTAALNSLTGNGLDSGKIYLGGESASANGLTPNTGAAFGGANTNVGEGSFILPVGKSAYNALQIVLQQQKAHPFRGVTNSNFQVSYNLSQAVGNSAGGSNEFFGGYGAYNQDNVNKYFGRTDLDHTNTVSFAGSLNIKYGLQIGAVGHFFSAPPSTLTLAGITGNGQIFKSDVDGDGTTSDLVPGTNPGDYMHRIKGVGLQQLINNYNATQAGSLTPAGLALVSAGLFTQQQLIAIGAAKQPLAPVPANPLKNAATRTFDASVKYPIRFFGRYRQGLVITPGVNMYNVTNMANFGSFSSLADVPTATPTTLASGTYLNSPNADFVQNRVRTLRGTGNGTFDQGGPRTTEFNLKIDF